MQTYHELVNRCDFKILIVECAKMKRLDREVEGRQNKSTFFTGINVIHIKGLISKSYEWSDKKMRYKREEITVKLCFVS